MKKLNCKKLNTIQGGIDLAFDCEEQMGVVYGAGLTMMMVPGFQIQGLVIATAGWFAAGFCD